MTPPRQGILESLECSNVELSGVFPSSLAGGMERCLLAGLVMTVWERGLGDIYIRISIYLSVNETNRNEMK